MKTYCLFHTLFLFVLNSSIVFAEIKNGYASDIDGARNSLQSLQGLLAKTGLSFDQRKKIKSKIQSLSKYITYFEETKNQIEQFKMIAPELYWTIDSLKDSRGRKVDVYVKFVSAKEIPTGIFGWTNVAQLTDDQHGYSSEFGSLTVSVRICIAHGCLRILAHEFGHVSYQVPNLAEYMAYYAKKYDGLSDESSRGHDLNDPSGQRASNFEKRFQGFYSLFKKNPS